MGQIHIVLKKNSDGNKKIAHRLDYTWNSYTNGSIRPDFEFSGRKWKSGNISNCFDYIVDYISRDSYANETSIVPTSLTLQRLLSHIMASCPVFPLHVRVQLMDQRSYNVVEYRQVIYGTA